MATWIQPEELLRQADTNTTDSQSGYSFTANFEAAGYIRNIPGFTQFMGENGALICNLPAVGDTVRLYLTDGTTETVTHDDVQVTEVTSTSTDTLVCKLSITLGRAYLAPEWTATVVEDDETIEIDWVIQNDPIENHPLFVRTIGYAYDDHKLNTGEGETESHTQGSLLNMWENAPSATKAERDKRKLIWDVMTSATRAVATYKAMGHGSYVSAFPVVRRTTRKATKQASKAGRRETPPEVPSEGTYYWVKTAARSVRQGRARTWELVEEWTGYYALSTRLYPEDGHPAFRNHETFSAVTPTLAELGFPE